MSFILDALKKAEAERHLGKVPSLHAQPGAALPSGTAALRQSKPWLMAAGMLLIAACTALAWFKPWQSPHPAGMPTALPAGLPVLPVLPQAAPALTPPEDTQHANAGMAAATPEIVEISPAPLPPAKPLAASKAKKAVAAAPERQLAPEKPHRPAAAAKKPASDADLKLSTTLTQNSPPPAAAAQREMPEAMPAELPKLAIGGYIYSENQRERQLLVNKRLLHEGDEAAPGVILEKMLPKAAVFIYRGQRYQVPY